MSGVSVFSFRAIELKFMWQISWKILVSFGLGRVQSLKIIYLAYQVESESLIGKIQSFERFKNFQHFWFLLWSIEPIRKDGNDGKLTIWLNYFLIGVSFLRLLMLIMFFAENNFFLVWSNITFWFNITFWPLLTCHLVLKFLFRNCKGFKSRPVALKFPLKAICSDKKPIKRKFFTCAECCFIYLNKY